MLTLIPVLDLFDAERSSPLKDDSLSSSTPVSSKSVVSVPLEEAIGEGSPMSLGLPS